MRTRIPFARGVIVSGYDTEPRISLEETAMEFQRTFSGAPWEKRVGYCRALRAGDQVFVTGTVAVDDDGSVFAPGDAYAQTKRCLEIIEKALVDLGADLSSVVRTRMFVADISRLEEYGRAHMETLADNPPATTMVGATLVAPEFLIEIEADAVCDA